MAHAHPAEQPRDLEQQVDLGQVVGEGADLAAVKTADDCGEAFG